MKPGALGVGIIYMPGLAPVLDRVSVIEVEPQPLGLEVRGGAEPFHIPSELLEPLRALPQPKLVHAVGYPLGGSRAPDPGHVPPLARAISTLEARWASEHLSFNETGGFRTGFLLPPRQTVEGAEAAAKSIRSVSSRLPVPLSVETGVNYLRPRADELPDGEFLREVVERADCGLLLDLHNLWCNERNGRQPVREVLEELPRERIWEVHLAGGLELDGYWLDAHSGAVPGPLMSLAAELLPTLPELRALIFEMSPQYLPDFGAGCVERELESLWRLWDSSQRKRAARRHEPPQHTGMPTEAKPKEWEETLGALAVGRTVETRLGRELEADPGTAILRKLVTEFRAGMVVDALKLTSRLMLLEAGEAVLREHLRQFGKTHPPELFASAEGEAFSRYLEAQDTGVPYLREVLAFELALIHTQLTGESLDVTFTHDPAVLLGALARGERPTAVPPGEYTVNLEARRPTTVRGTPGTLSQDEPYRW